MKNNFFKLLILYSVFFSISLHSKECRAKTWGKKILLKIKQKNVIVGLLTLSVLSASAYKLSTNNDFMAKFKNFFKKESSHSDSNNQALTELNSVEDRVIPFPSKDDNKEFLAGIDTNEKTVFNEKKDEKRSVETNEKTILINTEQTSTSIINEEKIEKNNGVIINSSIGSKKSSSSEKMPETLELLLQVGTTVKDYAKYVYDRAAKIDLKEIKNQIIAIKTEDSFKKSEQCNPFVD